MALVNDACRSAAVSGATTVKSTGGTVYAMTIKSGTAAGSMTLRDGGSGGTVLWVLNLPATAAAGDQMHSISFPCGLRCGTDIWATITGAGVVGYVAYS